MKQALTRSLAAGIAVLFLASGCGSQTAILTATPPSAPPATLPAIGGPVSASVEVEPAQWSNMAFLIEGRVTTVQVKAGDAVLKGQQLIVLEAPELEYAAITAQAEADSAQINQFLQRSSRQYKVWAGRKLIWTRGPQELRIKADARLQQALGALDVAKAELAQGTLMAPFDGTVVSIDAAPGEMVDAYETVLVLADLSHMRIVTTDLSEREVGRIRIGQPAIVRLKAFESALEGTVRGIDVMAGKSKDGDTVFKVTVELGQQPEGLFWGMTGEVQIEAPS